MGFGSKLAPIVASHLQSEPDTASQQALGIERAHRRTNHNAVVDKENHRPLTPERKSALLQTDRASTSDWSCGMQTLRTAPVRLVGSPAISLIPPAVHTPSLLR